MKQTDKNKVATLSEWLEIATKGLAAPGKERITREIEAHFNEAVQIRLVQGQSEDAAQMAALADLGEPKRAARRFRRTLLTEKEAGQIANLVKAAPKTSHLFSGYLAAIIYLLGGVFLSSRERLNFPEPHLLFIAIMLALISGPTTSFLISKLHAIKPKTPLVVMVDCVTRFFACFIGIPFLLFSASHSDGFSWSFWRWVIWMITFGVVSGIVPRFRTWNKVRKMTADFDETTGIAG